MASFIQPILNARKGLPRYYVMELRGERRLFGGRGQDYYTLSEEKSASAKSPGGGKTEPSCVKSTIKKALGRAF